MDRVQVERAWLNVDPGQYTFGGWLQVNTAANSAQSVLKFVTFKYTYIAAYDGPQGIQMSPQNSMQFRLDDYWLNAHGGFTSIAGASLKDEGGYSFSIQKHRATSASLHVIMHAPDGDSKRLWMNNISGILRDIEYGKIRTPESLPAASAGPSAGGFSAPLPMTNGVSNGGYSSYYPPSAPAAPGLPGGMPAYPSAAPTYPAQPGYAPNGYMPPSPNYPPAPSPNYPPAVSPAGYPAPAGTYQTAPVPGGYPGAVPAAPMYGAAPGGYPTPGGAFPVAPAPGPMVPGYGMAPATDVASYIPVGGSLAGVHDGPIVDARWVLPDVFRWILKDDFFQRTDGDVTITDGFGRPVLKGEGKFFSAGGDHTKFYDMTGSAACELKKRALTWSGRQWKVMAPNQEVVATIYEKKSFSRGGLPVFRVYKGKVHIDAGGDVKEGLPQLYQVEGSWTQWNFRVQNAAGAIVARLDKQFGSLMYANKQLFTLECAPGVDTLLMLIIGVAVDNSLKEDERDREREMREEERRRMQRT